MTNIYKNEPQDQGIYKIVASESTPTSIYKVAPENPIPNIYKQTNIYKHGNSAVSKASTESYTFEVKYKSYFLI